MPSPTVFFGRFIHTPTLGHLDILEDHVVFVDERGVIIAIYPNGSARDFRWDIKDLVDAGKLDGEWCDPGRWSVVDRRDGEGRSRWFVPGFVGE